MKKIYLIISTLFLFLVNIAVAQVWTGTVNSQWNNPNNWSLNNVPVNGTGSVTIPGIGIVNWPELTGDIDLAYFEMQSGGRIDTKGFKIKTQRGNYDFDIGWPLTMKISGAIISNSIIDTDIYLNPLGKAEIDNSIFEKSTVIDVPKTFFDNYSAYPTCIESGNHFLGNVKYPFNGYGGGVFTSYNSPSTYESNVEFEQITLDVNYASTYNPRIYFFEKGAIVKGNCTITNTHPISSVYYDQPFILISGGGTLRVDGSLSITHTGQVDVQGNVVHGNGMINITGKFKTASVTGSWDIKGSMTIGTGIMNGNYTFQDNSTISSSGANAYFTGKVTKVGDDAFSFPVGRNGKLTPVSISAPANVGDAFSVDIIESNPNQDGYPTSSKSPSLAKVLENGYFDIQRVAGSSNVIIELPYNDVTGLSSQSELRVAHWNGVQWDNFGNGGTTGSFVSGTVRTMNAVASFSPFAVGSTSGTLPVKLTEFEVVKESNIAVLNWSTSLEINSDKFEIERSRDVKNWVKIAVIKALGDSDENADYQFKDAAAGKGQVYYRLKMVDKDGSYSYSAIKSIYFDEGNVTIIYPNPTSDQISIEAGNGQPISFVKVINERGIVVKEQSVLINPVTIQMEKSSPGIYHVVIQYVGGLTEKRKIVVVPSH